MMFPIMLDLDRVAVALVGNGAPAARRLAQFDEAAPRRLTVFADAPSPELATAAGTRLVRRLPDEQDLAVADVVLIVDLPRERAEPVAALGRRLGRLVNVEDVIPLCDFHMPSMVRRGDLLLAVSTAGRSPALARRLRRHLEREFGPEWAGRLDELASERARWRAEGADMATVAKRSEELIDRRGWLP